MMKCRKRMAVLMLSMCFLFGIGYRLEAEAITLEGQLGTIKYTANANATPGWVYEKISSSESARHSGKMEGRLQAYLGITCCRFSEVVPIAKGTSNGKTWYVDVEHTIYDAVCTWYMNGKEIESTYLLVDPY